MTATHDYISEQPQKWDSPDGRSPLSSFTRLIHPVSEELLDYIDANCFSCSVGRGRFLLKAGEICQHVYFIRKGVLRAYVREGSKEITTWITPENEMITSIRSFFDLRIPSRENIQALEDSELVGASYEQLQYLYDHFLEMNVVGRKLLERYYRDAEERAFICRLTRAVSKYEHFLATKGELANRVPLKYIASYLGMTLETLSRVRKKFR